MDLSHPTTIGKYEVQSVIHRGGTGLVYRALDPFVGRLVAIKTLTDNVSADDGLRQRFLRETEERALLQHPNFLTTYEIGEHNGSPYVAMGYVNGDTLDRCLVERGTSWTIKEKLQIIEHVCAGLAYAHERGFVLHCDLAPRAVIVLPDGTVKLPYPSRRFSTKAPGLYGFMHYMAPEQLLGKPCDRRTDIFIAGLIMFQCITGKLPFGNSSGSDLEYQARLINENHPPLGSFISGYPPDLDRIINRSLAKDQADRYQTADEMAADIYDVIEVLVQQECVELKALARQSSSDGNRIGAERLLSDVLRLNPRDLEASAMRSELRQQVMSELRHQITETAEGS